MGLLDYYRQFEDVDERELNEQRRERRRRERELALQEIVELDLSGTEWPDFPNSEVVNASIYTARGRVNGYPDRHARAAPGGGDGAAVARRRAGDALAVVPALPADGRARGREAGGGRRAGRGGRGGDPAHAGDRDLTVFRTFSKISGLSGLRAGYAVGGSTELLDAIAPVLGVNALTQSAVPGAEDRRPRGGAPPRGRDPRARPPARGTARARAGPERQPGELRVAGRPGPQRRGAGNAAAPARP